MFEKRMMVGNHVFRVVALGPASAAKLGSPAGWSLGLLQRASHASINLKLARALEYALTRFGTENALAPRVAAANAKICRAEELVERIALGRAVLHRSPEAADGVFMQRKHSFVVSAGGCPLIIATTENATIIAHAGRDSLIDRGAVMGTPARPHLSVVDAIVSAYGETGKPAHEIHMTMTFAVPCEQFAHDEHHPTYGEFNRALIRLIENRWPGSVIRPRDVPCIDLETLFTRQAEQAGVTSLDVKYGLETLGGSFAHTRDGKDPRRRNLVIVTWM